MATNRKRIPQRNTRPPIERMLKIHNLLKRAAEEPPGAIVVDGSLDDWNIPASTFYT